MAVGDIQTSFAAGELSPQLYARVDLDKFQVGAALLRNFFVDYRGGVSNRPGTQYIDRSSKGARLIPFVVSTAAAYVLVFTNLLITVYNKGALVTTVVSPYLTADLFDIQYTQSADVLTLVHPNYPPADLSRTSDTTFSYAAIVTGPDIQPPAITSMRAPHSQDYMYGYVVTAVDADGKEESLPSNNGVRLSLVLNEGINQVIGLNWTAPAQPVSRYNVYKWGPNDLATMVASTTWGFVGTSLTTSFTDNNIAPDFSKQPPGWGDPFSGGQFQSISVNAGGAGYTTTGQFPNIPYVPLVITGDGVGAAGFAVLDNASGTIVGVYLTNPGKNYTHATVTAVGQGGTGATFNYTFSNIQPLNPAATAYLQQRRVFGGSSLKPETLVMSQPGLITNFNTTPVQLATDALVISIAAEEVNTIKSFVQVAYGLIAFTTGGSFLINGGSPGAAINANSPSIQPQVSQGANGLRPLRINYDVLYGQAKGNRIHNLAFAWQKQSYTGTDISTLAAHLFDTFLTVDWTYAEEPFKIVWAVRSDGHLLSLSYVPEQEVYAWTRHDTQGLFKSVCSVPEGNNDAVYFIVERFVPGVDPASNWVYYLERLHERQGCCIYDAWFLDCALALANPTFTSPLYITQTGPTTIAAQTFPPGGTPSGSFGGRPPIPASVGMLEFDTSAGGDGNGVAIPDWDHVPPRMFVSNAGSGACATYRLDALNTPPTQVNFHATHATQGLTVGAVDTAGQFYLGAGTVLNRLSSDLQTSLFTTWAALTISPPNGMFVMPVNGVDFLLAVGGTEVDLISISGVPTFVAKATTITEQNAGLVARGLTNSNNAWVLGTWNISGGLYVRQAQPAGLYQATLTALTVTLARKLSITPAMFGFNHISAGLDMLGDEYDGNPMIWAQSSPLANWSNATLYNQFDCVNDVATGHDYESKVGGNTGNAPAIGGNAFWNDLGVHDAVGGQNLIKINAATGAVMWTVKMIGGLSGYRSMSRIRYGKMRLLDVAAHASFNHWLWDLDTITGTGVIAATQDIWNVAPSAAKQFYNDKTGQWIAEVGYGFSFGTPGSPAPVGASANVFNNWGELGPAVWTFPLVTITAPIGDVIQVDCGKATVTASADDQHVVATIDAPFDTLVIPDDPNGLLAPVDPGDWTMTAPARVVTGLNHLEGKQVWALADGVVVGPLTVVGGSVDVGFLASSIVVGLKYTAQIQTLYLTTDGIQQGSDQGKRKQISGVTLRVDCTRGLTAGTDFGQYQTPVPELNDPTSTGLFTGDCRVLAYANWDERGFTMIEQDLPLPASVLGVIVEVTPGDDAS